MRTWLLWIAIISAYFYASLLSLAVGTVLLLLSMIIQFWSKGCLHRNSIVTRSGPYRFVRHPFYTGNFLLDGGIAVMSGFWPLILIFPFWWAAAYIPVMRKEEAKLTGLFGDEYRRYAESRPRVIPFRRPLPATEGGFSWRNRNIITQEVARGMRFLTYPAQFFLVFRLQQSGTELFLAPGEYDIAAFTVLIVLNIGSLLWTRYAVPRIHCAPRMSAVSD